MIPRNYVYLMALGGSGTPGATRPGDTGPAGGDIPPQDTTPPDKPTVSATAINFHEIQLLMSPSSDDVGVVQRRVYRDGVEIDDIAPDDTIYLDSQLALDTLYSYTILDTDAASLSTASDAAAARTASTYRIDSGQTVDYDATTGYRWYADTAITGATLQGTVTAQPISGTPDPLLYQSVAVEASAGAGFSYSFPLESGDWRAVYHFAEYVPGTIADDRRFDISIDGAFVYSLDVYSEAGLESVLIKDFLFTSDGQFETSLVGTAGNAFVAALEILPVLEQPAGLAESLKTPTEFQVDCTAVTDAVSYRWYLDSVFAGSSIIPSMLFSGLVPSTAYDVEVEAVDIFDFASPISAALQVTTNAAVTPSDFQLLEVQDSSEYLRIVPYGAAPDTAGDVPVEAFVSFADRDNLTRFSVVRENAGGDKDLEDVTGYDSWECKLYAVTDLGTPLYTLDSAVDAAYFDLTDPDAVGVYFGKVTGGGVAVGVYTGTLAGIITATAPQGKQVKDAFRLEHRNG